MTIAEAKQNLVSLARSQLGYREGANNYNKYADDPDITRLYGWCPQNQPWCCTFVNWCFLNAFGFDIGSRLTYGGTAACSNSASLFRNHNAFVQFPEIGDQAFFYSGAGINHTGIVVAVDGSAFTTIEGNYSDKVSEVRHNIGNGDVAGFGRPCWEIVSGESTSGQTTDGTAKPQNRTTLRKGMSGEDVKQLQEKLIAAGYNVGPDGADGEFGNNTFKAVVAFQEDHGLAVDGVAGPETIAALNAEPEENEQNESDHALALPELQLGSKGDAVYILQGTLNLRGFNCGKPDGTFGPKTATAVNRFKEYKGLEQNGVVDSETWQLLIGEG